MHTEFTYTSYHKKSVDMIAIIQLSQYFVF